MPFKKGDLVETCQNQYGWNPLIREQINIPIGTHGWIVKIIEHAGGLSKEIEEIGNHTPRRAAIHIRFLTYPVTIYSPSAVRNITSKIRKQDHATRKALEIQQARTFGPTDPRQTQNREVAGSGD